MLSFEENSEGNLESSTLSLLEDEEETVKERLKSLEAEWEQNGCSILMDVWSGDTKKKMMNLCVNSRESRSSDYRQCGEQFKDVEREETRCVLVIMRSSHGEFDA